MLRKLLGWALVLAGSATVTTGSLVVTQIGVLGRHFYYYLPSPAEAEAQIPIAFYSLVPLVLGALLIGGGIALRGLSPESKPRILAWALALLGWPTVLFGLGVAALLSRQTSIQAAFVAAIPPDQLGTLLAAGALVTAAGAELLHGTKLRPQGVIGLIFIAAGIVPLLLGALVFALTLCVIGPYLGPAAAVPWSILVAFGLVGTVLLARSRATSRDSS